MRSADAPFERIARTAAELFLAKGYAGVSLREVAAALGIRAASLYHHCPAGKAELYRRSLEVFLADYREGLAGSRGRARFPERLLRMTDWMLEHPPVDLQHIVRVDLPHLDEAAGLALNARLHDAVLGPYAETFEEAKRTGAVVPRLQAGLAAACVVSLVHGLGFAHVGDGEERRAAKRTVRAGVRLLLDGALPSPG